MKVERTTKIDGKEVEEFKSIKTYCRRYCRQRRVAPAGEMVWTQTFSAAPAEDRSELWDAAHLSQCARTPVGLGTMTHLPSKGAGWKKKGGEHLGEEQGARLWGRGGSDLEGYMSRSKKNTK